MSVGLPSIITHDTGLSEACRTTGAAVVCDGRPETIADGIVALLRSPSAWQKMSDSARALVKVHYSIDAVVNGLLDVYDDARS